MPRRTMKCRVCGAEYEACTSIKAGGPFNWREVACSPECGEIYLARVNEARRPKEEEAVREYTFSPVTTFQSTAVDFSSHDEDGTPEFE